MGRTWFWTTLQLEVPTPGMPAAPPETSLTRGGGHPRYLLGLSTSTCTVGGLQTCPSLYKLPIIHKFRISRVTELTLSVAVLIFRNIKKASI